MCFHGQAQLPCLVLKLRCCCRHRPLAPAAARARPRGRASAQQGWGRWWRWRGRHHSCIVGALLSANPAVHRATAPSDHPPLPMACMPSAARFPRPLRRATRAAAAALWRICRDQGCGWLSRRSGSLGAGPGWPWRSAGCWPLHASGACPARAGASGKQACAGACGGGIWERCLAGVQLIARSRWPRQALQQPAQTPAAAD